MVTKFSTLAVFAAFLGSALTTHSFAMEIAKEDSSSFYTIQRYYEEPSGTVKIEQKGAGTIGLSDFELYGNPTYCQKVKEDFESSHDLQEQRIGSFIRTVMPTARYELSSLGNEQYGISVNYNEGKMHLQLIRKEHPKLGKTYDLYVTEPTNFGLYDQDSQFSKSAPSMRFILRKSSYIFS